MSKEQNLPSSMNFTKSVENLTKNLDSSYGIQLNYQVLQNEKGALDFLIEQQLSTFEQAKLIEEIEKYFKKDIVYKILDGQPIINRSGKLKSFISSIS